MHRPKGHLLQRDHGLGAVRVTSTTKEGRSSVGATLGSPDPDTLKRSECGLVRDESREIMQGASVSLLPPG